MLSTQPRALVGKRVRVWFDDDGVWYHGCIVSYSSRRGHFIKFDPDPDEDDLSMWFQSLDEERWELVPVDNADTLPTHVTPVVGKHHKTIEGTGDAEQESILNTIVRDANCGDRYFVPAALWPEEVAHSTPYGLGWLATIFRVRTGRNRTITFLCDGEAQAITMQLAPFVNQCQSVKRLELRATISRNRGARNLFDLLDA
eukprot:3438587-Prymnesium_polylepis.1